jgi:hypothetical protein
VSGTAAAVIAGMAIGVVAAPATAQTARDGQERDGQAVSRPVARPPALVRNQFDQLRYQIGTMERVLETAVEHGASVWRDRLQALAPVQALLLDNARVRGYRLEGYGMFFDIDVPSLETTLFSAFRTLDQNGLGVQSALNQLKAFVQTQAAGDVNVQQALKRIELQVVPAAPGLPSPEVAGARTAAGSAAVAADPGLTVDPSDPILVNPEEVYRAEVMQAVVDALLDYSAPLGLSGDEWLTVGVRRNEVRPRIGLETNAQTFVARVRGNDLSAFRSGQVTRDEAIKRVEVRVF